MVHLFIAKFDVIKGNSLIYTSDDVNASHWKGIEFKALPSGLHQSNYDIVRFKEGDKNGISIYRQNGLRLFDSSPDRSKIKMLSVGLIYKSKPQNLEGLLASIDKELIACTVSDSRTEESFVERTASLFKKYTKDPYSIGSSEKAVQDSMMKSFKHAGPFFYNLWRSFLVNKRVLISNRYDSGVSSETVDIINKNTSLLTNIQELVHQSASKIKGLTAEDKTSKILNNITLSDIDVLKKLTKAKTGYFACTSDEIFLTKTQLFDYLMTFDNATKKPILKKVVQDAKDPKIRNLVDVHFSKNDLTNFVRMQTGEDFASFTQMYNEWSLLLDKTWSTIIGEYIYGVPRSSFNLETEDDQANEFTSHFATILTYYYSTISDIIKNSDEDCSYPKIISEDWSELDETSSESNVENEIDLTYSDIHQLYFNPFSLNDKEFIVQFASLYFNRSLTSPSPFQSFFAKFSLSCC